MTDWADMTTTQLMATIPERHRPNLVSLDISPDPVFTRKFGKRLKNIGGNYHGVRGQCRDRLVRIPLTDEGEKLMLRVLAEDGLELVPLFSDKQTSARINIQGTGYVGESNEYSGFKKSLQFIRLDHEEPNPVRAVALRLAQGFAREEGVAFVQSYIDADEERRQRQRRADHRQAIDELRGVLDLIAKIDFDDVDADASDQVSDRELLWSAAQESVREAKAALLTLWGTRFREGNPNKPMEYDPPAQYKPPKEYP